MLYFFLGLVVVVGVVIVFSMSLFVRRHGESGSPRSGWRPTAELFRDPGTGRILRVWLDPAGGRHYVPESSGRTR